MSVARFAVEAEEFVAFIRGCARAPRSAFFVEATQRLAILIARALELPDVEPPAGIEADSEPTRRARCAQCSGASAPVI